jgi:hypothetical protein
VRYETLVRVSQVIGAHGDPKELFGVLVNELHRVVQFDFIGVSLRDKNSDTFQNYFIDMTSRVVGELAARTKTTRKTIESGIPENCPVELPFWTR